MNSLVRDHFPLLRETLELRHQLLDIIEDTDLAYALPGNATLAALLREMAAFEEAYAASFTTFTLDFAAHTVPSDFARDVESLKRHFAVSEARLMAAIESLSDETIETQVIAREGFEVSVKEHYFIYREALLIEYGKISLYLHALERPYTEKWENWIG